MFNDSGKTLGLEDDGGLADNITIEGSIGGDSIAPFTLTFDSNIPGGTATTVYDLLTAIRSAFNLPKREITLPHRHSVEVNPSDSMSVDSIDQGAIIIRGLPGTDFAITNISISANNADGDQTLPVNFNSNMILAEKQTAYGKVPWIDDSLDTVIIDTLPKGTIVHSKRFLKNASKSDPLVYLFDEWGRYLGFLPGDTIIIEAEDFNSPNAGIKTVKFEVSDTSSIQYLVDVIHSHLSGNISGCADITTSLDTAGLLEIDMTSATASASIDGFIIMSSRQGFCSYITYLFSYGPYITTPGGESKSFGGLRVPATADDFLKDLYDIEGATLGLEAGDSITINGATGGNSVYPGTVIYSETLTMKDLLTKIQNTFLLPDSIQNRPSVNINPVGETGDSCVPLGAVVIRGKEGLAFELKNISVTASNTNNNQIVPQNFINNMIMTEIQKASGATSIVKQSNVPFSFDLLNVFFEPLKSSAIIWYSIPVKTSITLRVFNLKGKEIETLQDKIIKPGRYTYRWNCRHVSPGVYLLSLSSKKHRYVNRFIIVR